MHCALGLVEYASSMWNVLDWLNFLIFFQVFMMLHAEKAPGHRVLHLALLFSRLPFIALLRTPLFYIALRSTALLSIALLYIALLYIGVLL